MVTKTFLKPTYLLTYLCDSSAEMKYVMWKVKLYVHVICSVQSAVVVFNEKCECKV